MPKSKDIERAYAYCQKLAQNHYENFPVASILVPKALRKPISAVYAFARTADDIADEGDATNQERIAKLDEFQQNLNKSANDEPVDHPIFIALADVIKQHPSSITPLGDLLKAFRSDVTTNRYQTDEQLLDYCRYSANPVGKLVLILSNNATPENIAYSDNICSALQLINFLQDIDIDYQDKQRIYIPLDDMQRFNVSETVLANKQNSNDLYSLVNHQIDRAESLLNRGLPLPKYLPGRLGWEIKLTIAGAQQVIKALRRRKDIFSQPHLTKSDWLSMATRALFA